MAEPANAQQIEYWNSDAGRKWAAMQERIDGVFAPITQAVVALAAPLIGERALDIGCGCGATIVAVSPLLGPSGSVLGVDISEPMLAVAHRRISEGGLNNASAMQADAAHLAFPPASADLALSRFGVMFFEDPTAAFVNIRTALRKGGRVAFVCWRAMAETPCFLVPFAAAKAHLPKQPPAEPNAPGPFGFANPQHLRGILSAAGFSAIEISPRDIPLAFGSTAEAADWMVRLGPVSRALNEADDASQQAAMAAIQIAMSEHDGPAGVVLDAGLWLVTARNS